MSRALVFVLTACTLNAVFSQQSCDPCHTNSIWLDIVNVIDTSNAMGYNGFEQVVTLVMDPYAVMTLPDQAYDLRYSRVGLIYAADNATVVYNLNMTSKDIFNLPHPIVTSDYLDLEDGVASGITEFGHRSLRDRSNARQIIVLALSGYSSFNQSALNAFKASGGTVIVYQFVQRNETVDARLQPLASDGYYFNSVAGTPSFIALFCKLSCYCAAGSVPYTSLSGTVDPNQGCFIVNTDTAPYDGATAWCASKAQLVSIHNSDANSFIYNLINGYSKTASYWIGFAYSSGQWVWADGASDNYTSWAPSQPSYATCAYAKQSGLSLLWYSASNCSTTYNFICQGNPCSSNYYCR